MVATHLSMEALALPLTTLSYSYSEFSVTKPGIFLDYAKAAVAFGLTLPKPAFPSFSGTVYKIGLSPEHASRPVSAVPEQC